MKYRDKNKKRREQQRRFLQRNGWIAVDGYTKERAFRWKWILPGVYKKAYSREEAVAIETRRQKVSS
jgi:hypothetical protein